MDKPVIPSEAELTLLRAHLNLQRRRDRRYRAGLATSGKLQFADTGETLSAWIINLSRSGVGLDMSKTLAIGQEFVLLVRTVDKGTVRLNARVTHVTPTASGGWRIGSEFTEKIDDDFMESLL